MNFQSLLRIPDVLENPTLRQKPDHDPRSRNAENKSPESGHVPSHCFHEMLQAVSAQERRSDGEEEGHSSGRTKFIEPGNKAVKQGVKKETAAKRVQDSEYGDRGKECNGAALLDQ